ncbi:MAG: DUF2442 domain-containing protein [Bacteroidia bacterium]
MKKIISLLPMEDFQFHVKFDDGTEKKFDLKPYFQFPVFLDLKNKNLFPKAVNRGYFIEWEGQEIDLSADTLWHEGKQI